MRRTNATEVVVERPDKGLVTDVPSDLPDKARNQAIVIGENVRAEYGVLRNAPGYERIVMDPSNLDSPANLVFQANILHNDSEVRNTPIVGTEAKLFTLRRRAQALTCAIDGSGNSGNTCPLRVAFLGDSGSLSGNLAAVATGIKNKKPDIIIHTGDMTYADGGGSSTINDFEEYVGQFFYEYIGGYNGIYGVGPAINKFFPTLGNHDWDDGGINNYLDFFQLAKNPNERYFHYKRGPIHFIHLSGYAAQEPDGVTVGSTQYNWAAGVLAASDCPWRIVVVHFPPYCSDINYYSGVTALRWGFEALGATAVVSGHAHNQEWLLVGGMPYLVTGAGGHDLRAFHTIPSAFSIWKNNTDFGFLLLDANKTQLDWTFCKADGTALQSFSQKTPKASSGVCYIGDAGHSIFTLEIVPDNAGVEVGFQWGFQVLAYYEDGSVENVTLRSVWTTSDESIATIGSATGVATGVSPGTVVVTAEFGGQTDTANLTVFHSCLDDPTDLIFVVERTDSMSSTSDGGSRLQHVKEGIEAAMKGFDSTRDKMGLVSFAGTYVGQIEDATSDVVPTSDFNLVRDTANTLVANGTGSGIASGLDAARLLIASSVATVKAVVLIVDGPATVTDPGGTTSSEAAAIAAAMSAAGTTATLLRGAGVKVVIIGYAVPTAYKASLATLATSGFVWWCDTASELAVTMALLANTFCNRDNYYYYGPADVYSTELNYYGFLNWDVVRGAVDLVGEGSNGKPLFDVLPGNGMYVDLNGTDPSTWPATITHAPDNLYYGKLQSKGSFNFVAGKTYRYSLYVAGNNVNRDGIFGLDLSISNSVLAAQTIIIEDKLQPFTLYSYEFTVGSDTAGKLIIDGHNNAAINGGNPNVGLLIDQVKLENVTDNVTMLFDTFDNENPKS
jgi:tartrate-resistant acid phosphatase type 5